ncbi:hypothetical protein [Georgenia sp. SUBG003]|uniref:hypothetical protein n=1 Tax=Georgenia sp. SUBG003 TaxID=1497974 RepID=UPI003AB16412
MPWPVVRVRPASTPKLVVMAPGYAALRRGGRRRPPPRRDPRGGGAFRDALALLDRVRPAATGEELADLLTLRADMLNAAGHPDAVDAHREALAHAADPARVRHLRTNLSKAALVTGDLDTAALALEGLEPDGENQAADAELILARGHVHLFTGDLDGARDDAELAKRQIVLAAGSPNAAFDLVAFEALLAHYDGQFFHRLHAELRRGAERPQLATGLFDSHLCVAEYVLYGPTPYEEVVALADACGPPRNGPGCGVRSPSPPRWAGRQRC